MKNLSPYILFAVLISCNNSDTSNKENTAESSIPPIEKIDTLIAKKDVTKVIPGSEYLKRAYSYTLIIASDTSAFKCHFSEWKADNSLFFVSKFHPSKSYRNQITELKKILEEANKDFNLALLKTVGMGRLIETGDLAVKVSNQYFKQYGNGNTVNISLDTFLLNSALGTEFNTILQPYGLKVKEVVTEKKFFINKTSLFQHSIIESEAASIPEKILDCITYLKVEKIK
jgi:hypothetical protein